MLYDLLPPVTFFASLSGIIVILSRVMRRSHRAEISAAIQEEAETTTTTVESEQLLRPAENNLHLVRSRFSLFRVQLRNAHQQGQGLLTRFKSISQTPPSTEETIERSTPAAVSQSTINIPQESWYSQRMKKVTQLSGALKERFRRPALESFETTEEIKQAAQSPRAEETEPTIRLVNVPPAAPETKSAQAELAQTEEKVVRKERPARSTAPLPAVAPSAVPPLSHSGPASPLSSQPFNFQFLSSRQAPRELQTAQQAFQSAQYQQVEDILVPYIVKHTKDTVAYMLLGWVALKRRTWPEAVEIFEQVIQLNKNTPGAYASLGYAAFKAGKITKALQALQRAHDADPQDRRTLKYLLAIAQRMDNRVFQNSLLHELLTLEPDNQEYLAQLRHLESREQSHVGTM